MDAASVPEAITQGTEAQAEKPSNHEQTDGESQTASEYVCLDPLLLNGVFSPSYVDSTDRFINSQLQLEADAREALPYVREAHGNSSSRLI